MPACLAQANVPNMKSLAQAGAYTLRSVTDHISMSAPSWTSMLTAVNRSRHRVFENTFAHSRVNVSVPSIFTQIHNAGLNIASIASWDPINDVFGTPDTCKHSVKCSGNDNTVVDVACTLLQTDPDLHFMFLHFDEIDHAGHEHGFSTDSAEYVAQIERADAQVGRVIDALASRGAKENWLVIITTDHGGKLRGHGSHEAANRHTFVILSGCDYATRGLHNCVCWCGLP